MSKFVDMIEKKLLPVANKLARQKYVQAISNGLIALLPTLTIGSFALILIAPPADYTTLQPGFLYGFMKGWAAIAEFLSFPMGILYTITMEFMALLAAASIAAVLARHYDMKGFLPTLISMVTFLLFAGFDETGAFNRAHLGGTGLFTAILISILTVEFLRFLLNKKVGNINVGGQGVPPAITQSFEALAPAAIVLVTASLLSWVIVLLTGSTLPNLMGIIMSPLVTAIDSIWGVLFLALLVMIFWWFGIHDTAITGPLTPFLSTMLLANMSAYAAGTSPMDVPHIVTEPFWWTFMTIGGSGATFGLCILLLTVCKSHHLKTVGRLGIVPSLFNINEPIIFGLPIMLNPSLFIPFVSAMMLNGLVTYMAMDFGLVAKTVTQANWNVFAPVAALISTLDIKAVILVVVLVLMDMAIYLPFIKAYDKQKYAAELSEAALVQE